MVKIRLDKMKYSGDFFYVVYVNLRNLTKTYVTFRKFTL